MRHCYGSFTRRELLAGSALAAGAWAARRVEAAVPAPAAPSSPVSIAKVGGYDEDLVAHFERMFDQLGGLGSRVRGKTVAMKLNLAGAAGRGRRLGVPAGRSHWVHPNVVAALTTVFGKLGAKRVRLLESTFRRNYGVPLEDTMLNDGWDVSAIQNAASIVEFEDTNGLGTGKQYSRMKVNTRRPFIFPSFDLNHSYEDCDFFVSVAKMKNHEELGITLSMKNLFGITPELLYGAAPIPEGASRSVRERVFHYGQAQPPEGVPAEIDPKSSRYEGWRMPRLLTDICGARPIDLAVLDGIEALMGGESPGIPGTKLGKPQLLIVGQNCVCTDAVAMAAMGYNPRASRNEKPFILVKAGHFHPQEQVIPESGTHAYSDNTVMTGEEAGIGTADLSKIDIRGTPLKNAVYSYEEHRKGEAPA
ncbi:MAG: DUF362 domain-containing protein [Bryobacteraceae bacterium]|nr:DUF362 domain-containing protein [Bryobacteraceae bacterium]